MGFALKSKLSEQRDDLCLLYTSVSRVEMTTRARGQESGVRLTAEGGENMRVQETGCPQGTTLVMRDLDVYKRQVRDMLDEDVDCVRTDDRALFERLTACARALTPALEDRIALHGSDAPLFDLLRVDHQLEAAFDRRVYLKSGGNLVIDETEALTVIDVNTAKFTGKKSLEETIFRLNCEAADEIARQLRLRDLGGIIVIDFIDMETVRAREALIAHLRAALSRDRNRTNVLGMTCLLYTSRCV